MHLLLCRITIIVNQVSNAVTVGFMLQQLLGIIHVNICWPDAVSTCQSEGREETPDSDQLPCISFVASMES